MLQCKTATHNVGAMQGATLQRKQANSVSHKHKCTELTEASN